ncbi:MAG TPA: OsmC family protein [Caulobacteraceae bacterium]|jgi:putative redox protein|nr:OsmC family protein [Caulobacteraceae bacterium]
MVHATLGEAPYRVDIEAGGHQLVADEGPALGGGNVGPGPFELVLSGLAACTLITLRMYGERKQWPTLGLSVKLRHRVEDGRHLIDREVEVTGAPDDAGVARLRDIAERTPVTLALKAGFAISTVLNPVTV